MITYVCDMCGEVIPYKKYMEVSIYYDSLYVEGSSFRFAGVCENCAEKIKEFVLEYRKD